MRRAAWLVLLLAACSEAGSDLPADAHIDFPDAAPQVDSVRFDARRAIDATPPDAPDPPPRYPAEGETPYSPITPSVKRNLEAIVLRGPTLADDEFSKIGDSITVADTFMKCFATASADLGAFVAELGGTLDHFKLADPNPYARVSLAAKVGVSALWAITATGGTAAPLEQETGALMPRYAVVLYGSNDVANGDGYIYTFGPTMIDIVDQLAAKGIVPIMSTIPPNTDQTLNRRILRFNEVVRGIAQARQLPLVDYNREMLKLPMLGLGPDGLHPNSYPNGGACKLTSDGLMYGYNVRNLLTLKSLDRARSVVEGDPAPDPPAAVPAVRGAGSYEMPFEINTFPWSDMHDTSLSTNTIGKYDLGKCMAAQNESGPELVYKLVPPAAVKVRAMVFDDNAVDVDIHLLKDAPTADKCEQRSDREIIASLEAGVTYYFVLDTFVPMATGTPAAGEYLFVIMEEP